MNIVSLLDKSFGICLSLIIMPLSKARDRLRKRIQSGNLQPSPTEVLESMPLYKRKERLADIINTPISPEQIKPGTIIAAIDILNKMDNVYEEKAQYQDNRQYNIIVSGDEARGKVERLLQGERPQITEGEKNDRSNTEEA